VPANIYHNVLCRHIMNVCNVSLRLFLMMESKTSAETGQKRGHCSFFIRRGRRYSLPRTSDANVYRPRLDPAKPRVLLVYCLPTSNCLSQLSLQTAALRWTMENGTIPVLLNAPHGPSISDRSRETVRTEHTCSIRAYTKVLCLERARPFRTTRPSMHMMRR